MASTTTGVMAYALIPAAAVVAGGVLAAIRPPGPKLRSAVQHFAAGIVFAAVAAELLPTLMHERSPLAAIVGFALGVGVMLAIKRLTEATGQRGVSNVQQPTGLLITLGVDVAVDGLLIGIGFAAGAKQGALLTIALAVEVLFLGLSGAVALGKAGASRARMIATTAMFAVLVIAGATAGASLLGGLSGPRLEGVLSFGAAALLYLVTEELLVEAHEEAETPLLTATFFVGFVGLLVIEMIA